MKFIKTTLQCEVRDFVRNKLNKSNIYWIYKVQNYHCIFLWELFLTFEVWKLWNSKNTFLLHLFKLSNPSIFLNLTYTPFFAEYLAVFLPAQILRASSSISFYIFCLDTFLFVSQPTTFFSVWFCCSYSHSYILFIFLVLPSYFLLLSRF